MKRRSLFALLLCVGAILTAPSSAQVGRCVEDSIGRLICAPPGGFIMADAMGMPVCSRGQCAKDNTGRVYCSVIPGGGAILDSIGRVRCVGGCEDAAERYCLRPQ